MGCEIDTLLLRGDSGITKKVYKTVHVCSSSVPLPQISEDECIDYAKQQIKRDLRERMYTNSLAWCPDTMKEGLEAFASTWIDNNIKYELRDDYEKDNFEDTIVFKLYVMCYYQQGRCYEKDLDILESRSFDLDGYEFRNENC